MSAHEQLTAAQAALADLEGQRDRLTARVAEIATEREAVAPKALGGDEKARERLLALKRENAELGDHATDLASAITAARRDVETAAHVVTAHEAKEQAKRQIELADEWERQGAVATKALAEFVGAHARLGEIADRLNADGVPALGRELVRVNMARAIQSGVAGSGLQSEVIPRRDLTDISTLVGTWAARIRASAQQVVSGQKPPPPKVETAPPESPDDAETARMQAEIDAMDRVRAPHRRAVA